MRDCKSISASTRSNAAQCVRRNETYVCAAGSINESCLNQSASLAVVTAISGLEIATNGGQISTVYASCKVYTGTIILTR